MIENSLLKVFIRSKVQIEDDDLDEVLQHFRERKIEKGKFLLKKGHTAKDYFFIEKGAVKIYFNKEKNTVTGWVALEQDFFTDLTSLKYATPSHFHIEAIEASTVLVISGKDMDMLYEEIPAWQKFGRLIWEEAFLRVLKGAITFQSLSAQERYINAAENTELLQRVPLKDIASFLGVTPSTLSRLRKVK